jgi:hypothetical protein
MAVTGTLSDTMAHSFEDKRKFFGYRRTGFSIVEAAAKAHVPLSTAKRWWRDEQKRIKALEEDGQLTKYQAKNLKTPDHPMPKKERDLILEGIPTYDELCPEAKRALEDFAYFRRRYFGRISSPWQEAAAYECEALLNTPHKEYQVVNCPPGSGKSTLFTHDIPAWLACKNRAIRCLIGSRTERQAKWYTGRLRRSFERTVVLEADPDELRLGLGVDAESTLVKDFGYFKPMSIPGVGKDPWRIEEFVLAQPGGGAIEDKEASFTAFGMDSGFLGGRFQFIIWDDLVDKTNIRTQEQIDNLIEWYETEAETRLEPGGLLILQGQRMKAGDLYRYALDLETGDEEEGEEITKKYKHVVYKAHYEDKCENKHKTTDPPWPEGCLLDPRRLSWRDLKPIMANKQERFRVLYQQEDVDPASVLVQWDWINGGRGENGVEYVGCFDPGRRLGQLPPGIDTAECVSVCTADPSPTKNWAIQWWLYHPASEQRFLIDFYRGQLEAPELLDWLINERRFVGIMEEWQLASKAMGAPIQTWIIEVNAAQKFLLQYDHVKRWQIRHGVNLVPHTTGVKKMDSDLGIPMVQPHWKHGRYRLPGDSFQQLMPMLRELTRWELGTGKGSRTDDCVLANWFLEVHLPVLEMPNMETPQMDVPSWLGTPAFVRA